MVTSWLRYVFYLACVVSCLGLAEGHPVFSEAAFETQLRETLRTSSLTSTQKAKHVLNRMGYGGNPLSSTQRLDRLNTDEKIIDFIKAQLANVSSFSVTPADYVFSQKMSKNPEQICAEVKARGDKIAQVQWCRPGLTTQSITPSSDILGEFHRLSMVYSNRLNERDPEALLSAQFDLSHFGGSMFGALKARQAARALVDETHSFKHQLFDFWFNHFNVSLEKTAGKLLYQYIPVIEQKMMGSFHDLLLATARSPAMLFYLDNFTSGRTWSAVRAQALADASTSCSQPAGPQRQTCVRAVVRRALARHIVVNENYARELIELHTFGEGPGVHYQQRDVELAAQILSGWTIEWGLTDHFKFEPAFHIGGDKTLFARPLTVFHNKTNAGEGRALVSYLADHEVTARNISKKLIHRFVSEDQNFTRPLADHLSKWFQQTKGHLPSLYRVLLSSAEFWAPQAYESKAVRPLDKHARMARALGIRVVINPRDPEVTQRQIGRLSQISDRVLESATNEGQNIFACTPPTGFPDSSSHWLSIGSVLVNINQAFKVEDKAFNQAALTQADLGAASLPGRTTNDPLGGLMWKSMWYYFLDNSSTLRAPASGLVALSGTQSTILMNHLNQRFDFEFLTGRKNSNMIMSSGQMDRVRLYDPQARVNYYQLLPVRTQMSLHFGSEQASRY